MDIVPVHLYSSSHHESHHHHSHHRSRSSSLVPSPTPLIYRPLVSHQWSRAIIIVHVYILTPATITTTTIIIIARAPILIAARTVDMVAVVAENSEPVGPYASVPSYQPSYAAQPTYGPTLTTAAAPVHMRAPSPVPSGVPHGISSPQYPPSIGAPFEPPVQTRALRPVSRNPRSLARQPLVSQEVDAPDPTRRDLRCHPLFRHSRCTGRRKALCIGINYVGQSNPLHGCVDDARNVYQFLMENHRYPHSNIIVLTDDNRNPRSQPTQKNILNAMRWLVEGAHADDALFVHYSGHGGRTRDMDGDELDGWDEVIFPVDYKTAGIITDDVLHDALVKPLPSGCRLTAVFDSCHSGSILDLNYEFHSNGRVKSSPVARAFQQAKSTPADVVCFSGCKDDQTSADTVQGGVAVGAMSYAYLKILKRNPQITYIDLLRGVRDILKKKYSQKPQLSASHEVDINLRFVM
ncbi:caspase domain-containing protein [Russula ochroleuca]|uniref:Caspase domain-containing protein n=1 Tax=Russula ochroleuca TaxID=152965 RepID=A0A9P5N0E1_9AGAM|nr:caspase domain-containing protein [Russula ochroleuca]